jgi:hypothetical protein
VWIQLCGSNNQPIGTFIHFLQCRISAKWWPSVAARAFGRMRTAKPGRVWRAIVAFYLNKEKSVYRNPHWAISFLWNRRLELNATNHGCLYRIHDIGRESMLFQLRRVCGLRGSSQSFQANLVHTVWGTPYSCFRVFNFPRPTLKINKPLNYNICMKLNALIELCFLLYMNKCPYNSMILRSIDSVNVCLFTLVYNYSTATLLLLHHYNLASTLQTRSRSVPP